MIKTILLMLAVTSSLSFQLKEESRINPTQDSAQIPCDVIKDAFVWSLFKPITKILDEHNDNRQFMVDKLIEVKRLSQGQYNWETTVQVSTFEGAHNPPYRTYTITFTNLNSAEPKAVKVELNGSATN